MDKECATAGHDKEESSLGGHTCDRMGGVQSNEEFLPSYRYIEEKADRNTKDNASKYIMTLPKDESEVVNASRRLRFLCLHGRRTSAEIMRGQTMALRSYAQIDCVFLDAPYVASKPADDMISMIYPDSPYLEWFDPKATNFPQMLEDCIMYLIDFVDKYGPFDGIIGFSQGATVATLLMNRLKKLERLEKLLSSCVLIGGVDPSYYIPDQTKEVLDVNSLHIIGQKDELFESSLKLCDFYEESMATRIEHVEGHNIPSIRTVTYHLIKKWFWEVASGDKNFYLYKITNRES